MRPSTRLRTDDSNTTLETLCAAPTCLFTNGSTCDRTRNECPRCMRFDPLLNAAICTNLQNATVCRSNDMLCPETPLEAHIDNDDGSYTWIEIDSNSGANTSDCDCDIGPTTNASVPTTNVPSPAILTNPTPSPTEPLARTSNSSATSTLPPWLIVTLAVVMGVSAMLFMAALYIQRTRKTRLTDPTTIQRSTIGSVVEPSKNQFSPNSYGFNDDSNELSVPSSRLAGSPSSSGNDTNESAVPSTFAHRLEPSLPVPHDRKLPLLQPRTRIPNRTSNPLPSSRARYEQYSIPWFTGVPRVTLPAMTISHSRTTNEFEVMDDTSSNASVSCDDGDDVFLTDLSNTSSTAVADCDYVTSPPADIVDVYPDTSMTTQSVSGRMFSPMSVRTRDTAACDGDVLDTWASHRTSAPADLKREAQQQKLATWKAKFYHEL